MATLCFFRVTAVTLSDDSYVISFIIYRTFGRVFVKCACNPVAYFHALEHSNGFLSRRPREPWGLLTIADHCLYMHTIGVLIFV